MRIAFPTDDGVTIQRHFGHASHYAVVAVEDGVASPLELRSKESHQHGHSHEHDSHAHDSHAHDNHDHHNHDHHNHDHRGMFAPIDDCQVLIAGNMGTPAYAGAQAAGLQVLLTDEPVIERVLEAWMAGTLVSRINMVHTPGHHHGA